MSSTVKYEAAVIRGRRIIATQTKTNWSLGDLAASVETVTYGEGTIQRLADDIGIAYKTLLDYRRVSEAYSSSDRSELNTWTVHQVFASEDDRSELVKSRTWTVSEARAEVTKRNTDDSTDDSTEPADELEIARAEVTRLEGELMRARAKVAKIEAERGIKPATTPKATTPKATTPKATTPKATTPKATEPVALVSERSARHIVRGMPSHAPEDCTPACPLHANETASRTRRNSKAA